MTRRRLVLGTARLGMLYGIFNHGGMLDDTQVNALVATAWEQGVREFDTAQHYGHGECVLGAALTALGVSSEARVVTKLHPNLDYSNGAAIYRAALQSREQLKVPMLHGLLLHRESVLDQWEQGLRERMTALQERGIVRHLGVSVYTPARALQAMSLDGLTLLQCPTNCLDHRFLAAGLLHPVHRQKIIYVRSVFLQGMLLNDVSALPPHLCVARPYLERLETIRQEWHVTRTELALGFVQQVAAQAHILFGAESVAQVEENIRAWDAGVPAGCVAQIRQQLQSVPEAIVNPMMWS